MADKYFIFGAAFNGDGTTSAEAASAGAAGAWNQATILTGTAPAFGTLLAGDVVYIRSKTGAGANANISNVLAASVTIGGTAATVALPITWILDNGAVWPGVSGTLTYTTSSTSFSIAQRAFNRLIAASPHNWVLEFTATAPVSVSTTLLADTDGLKVSQPNRTSSSQSGATSATTSSTHHNFLLAYKQGPTGGQPMILANQCEARWVNPSIEVQTAVAGAVFGHTGFYGRHVLIGGQMSGTGATTGQALVANISNAGNAHIFEAAGFQVPKAVSLTQALPTSGSRFSLFGLDGGSGGALMGAWGTADSRNIDNFYPTLNATLADSASSGVSWRMYPQAATFNEPAMLSMCKIYTSAAATKTITLEFLLANPWGGGAANARSMWINVTYIDDTTGLPVALSTRDESSAALSTSTAAWSATTWGAVGFNKRKLAITTPSSIKQDTAVVVSFFSSAASASANDLLMICPDPQLT